MVFPCGRSSCEPLATVRSDLLADLWAKGTGNDFRLSSTQTLPSGGRDRNRSTSALRTPEATALDLIRYYRRAGSLSAVATLLGELSENLDAEKLVRAAEADGETAHAQRLGYLLDQYADPAPTAPLHGWISKQDPKFTPLRPGWRGAVQSRDEKWRVLVNDEVEPDL